VAEIKIQEKKRNLLPLILGALALLLLLGYCLTRDRGGAVADTTAATAAPDTVRAAGDAGTTGAAAAIGGGAAVADFVAFAGARDTAQETEANHQYTAGGVRRLAAALDELAAAGAGGSAAAAVDIRAYADSMRRSVDRLQQSAADDRHADDAKAAFSAAVSAMTAIDRARGPHARRGTDARHLRGARLRAAAPAAARHRAALFRGRARRAPGHGRRALTARAGCRRSSAPRTRPTHFTPENSMAHSDRDSVLGDDLKHLNHSGFDVAEGYPDIRGWDVVSRDGQKLGTVDDLVVSTSQMRVLYIDVDVDRSLRAACRTP
jgi:hypothetical protein